jgi:hypothetical protein
LESERREAKTSHKTGTGFKVKPKYKVGDLIQDTRPGESGTTYEITKVKGKYYNYKIFINGKHEYTKTEFYVDEFEPETRKLTKLDKILK